MEIRIERALFAALVAGSLLLALAPGTQAADSPGTEATAGHPRFPGGHKLGAPPESSGSGVPGWSSSFSAPPTITADGPASLPPSIHSATDAPTQGTTFDCGLDWDGDGQLRGDSGDLKLCFDAAKLAAGNANDGTDRSVVISIPDGTYDLSTGGWNLPYVLGSGMILKGVFPRVKWIAAAACPNCGEPPDLIMEPNGGTWLNAGDPTKTMFTTEKSRGIVIEDIGAMNFGTFFRAGGDNVDGASFTRFTNLYLLGIHELVDRVHNLVGIECYNCQHNYMDHINLYRLDTGIHWVSQNCWWQPSNSVWSDVWMVTRRSVTSPGFWFEALNATQDTGNCAAGHFAEGLNYITMIRPHVSAFTHRGRAGSTAFRFSGLGSSIFGFTLIGIDLEGSSEVGVLAEGNVQGIYLNFAGLTGSTTLADVKFQGDQAYYNTVDSRSSTMKLYTDSSSNFVYGQIARILPGSQRPLGLYRTYQDGNTYQVSGFATFSPYQTGVTGSGSAYGVTVNPFFGSSETAGRPGFFGLASHPALTFSTSGSRGDLVGIDAAPLLAGSGVAGNVASFFGVNSSPRVETTGAGTVITNMSGLRSAPVLAGDNYSLSELSYISADSTLARTLPPGAGVTTVFGLRLPDLSNKVGSDTREIAGFDAQTGQTDGSSNNVRFFGGDWNSGHLRLGSGHLWYDDTANRFRVREGAPTSTTDGRALVTVSSLDSYGVLLWGNPAGGGLDTGNAVCKGAGLSCVSTSDFSSMSTSMTCTVQHTQGSFAVQCR